MPKIPFNLLLLSLIFTSVATGILIRYIQNNTTQIKSSLTANTSTKSFEQDITQKISALDNPITVNVNSNTTKLNSSNSSITESKITLNSETKSSSSTPNITNSPFDKSNQCNSTSTTSCTSILTSRVFAPSDSKKLDSANPPLTDELVKYYKSTVGDDFATRIKDSSTSKAIIVNIFGSIPLGDDRYQVYTQSYDLDWLKSNKIPAGDTGRFRGIYIININEPFTWKFVALEDMADR